MTPLKFGKYFSTSCLKFENVVASSRCCSVASVEGKRYTFHQSLSNLLDSELPLFAFAKAKKLPGTTEVFAFCSNKAMVIGHL